MTKLLCPRKLVARIRAILKRTAGATAQPVQVGVLVLEPAARTCRVEGRALSLTATEFRLLEILMAQPGRLIARTTLIASIWGAQSAVSGRTLDSHLRNLRQKLATAGLAVTVGTV